ncbi:MAG: sodium:solute symporter family protein [Candidatus Lariskella arthropodorum]
MHTIDIIIVIAYLALCILIGLYKSRSIKTLKEYALGRNYFPDIVIITTLFATEVGAGSVMGSVSKSYALGLFFIVTRLVSPILWFLTAQIYGKNINQFLGLISISDIMEKLYGKAGRWVTNISSILLSIGVVALQAAVMGHLTDYFFGIGYDKSVIITVLILALYSSLGGIRAVALTDVFQFAVIMLAIPIACSFAYHDVGGYQGIVRGLPNDMLQLNLNAENILLFLSLIFYSFIPATEGIFIQRFLICKNSKQLMKCLNTIALITLPFLLIICGIGLIIRVKAPDIDPDQAFVYFISNYVSVGVKGFIIAGLLAVIMSTADSWLNTTSVLIAHDIIGKIVPLTEKQALFTARIATFVVCALAIDFARKESSIMELMWSAENFWGPIIAIPLIAGFLKFQTNSNRTSAKVMNL